jgi:hypothetical protein
MLTVKIHIPLRHAIAMRYPTKTGNIFSKSEAGSKKFYFRETEESAFVLQDGYPRVDTGEIYHFTITVNKGCA